MTDWREDLLTVILDCGNGDLYLLKDCQYDIGEIVEECIATFGAVKINSLVRIMFDYGLRDVEEAIGDRICELEAITNERDLNKVEEQELAALRELDPFEDMLSFHNFIDTHIWIDAKEKVDAYKKYMQEALDHFCEMTGFEIAY